MRILHYCPHTGGVMYEWHYVHFIDELKASGHHVIDCNPIHALGRSGTPGEYSEVLLDYARKLVDLPGPHMLFAATATANNIDPAVIDDIRRMGIPTVNFSVDDIVAIDLVRHVSAHFDLHWTTYYGTEKELLSHGCSVICLPMAANPSFFSASHPSRTHRLCFVGSRYGARSLYISKLAQAELPIFVAGNGWDSTAQSGSHIPPGISSLHQLDFRTFERLIRLSAGRKIILGSLWKRLHVPVALDLSSYGNVEFHGSLSLRDMATMYAQNTISLGVLEVANTYVLRTPVVQYRLREFEATMLGCLHIVRRTPELEDCFVEDQEIVFYNSLEECIDKARYYLAPQRYELTCLIGRQAREKSERAHNWLSRFEALWAKLGVTP